MKTTDKTEVKPVRKASVKAETAAKQASASRSLSMDELLESSDIKELKPGDVVEGVITSVRKHEMWVDLGANGVGVVMRREIGYGQVLKEGESVVTSVVDPELEEGYALLSMKRAAKDRGWDELEQLFEDHEVCEVSPYDANRGGLLVLVENDAKLAGLSEAILIKNEFKNVLYVTVGTGISSALITNGNIDPGLADSEGGQILVDHHGKMVQWEDIASGQAIVKRFGKRAGEIDDADTWKLIAHDLGLGLIDLIAVIQPEIIIMGGGVNTNFEKYIPYLQKELKKYETPLVPIPPIKQAARPEEAVIYGCYELTRARYESR